MAVLHDVVPLPAYWDLLNQHDWHFEHSDDQYVWNKGREGQEKIISISKHSPAHLHLLRGFQDHHFNGVPWGTPEQPKPTRPK